MIEKVSTTCAPLSRSSRTGTIDRHGDRVRRLRLHRRPWHGHPAVWQSRVLLPAPPRTACQLASKDSAVRRRGDVAFVETKWIGGRVLVARVSEFPSPRRSAMPDTKSLESLESLTFRLMASRVRILLTALLVGSAVFVMHVEMTAAQPETHPAAAHADHRDCADPTHCQSDSSHQRHLLTACSMVLMALLGVLLVSRLTRSRSASGRAARVRLSRNGMSTAAPFRPPDLAALAVMRC